MGYRLCRPPPCTYLRDRLLKGSEDRWLAEGGLCEDGGCGSGYWLAGWLDACLWLRFWCIFNMFSGVGLIRCSDTWIFMDKRFVIIFIDFRISWSLGCFDAWIFIDFDGFLMIFISFSVSWRLVFLSCADPKVPGAAP